MLQQLFPNSDVSLFVKRDDLLFPEFSGNKYRKLKYNLVEARELSHTTLLTFGGAFSNHIAAVAAAGKSHGFHTIGVIRGDELTDQNPTLTQAVRNGMELVFVSREDYRKRYESDYIAKLRERFGSFYLLPEGGSNALAVKGCAEILTPDTVGFDYICCAVGTGATLAGLAEGAAEGQSVVGFPALKGNFLESDVARFTDRRNWRLQRGYEFGGYAKISPELVDFMNDFYGKSGMPTDPVYTAKMFFGVVDMIQKGNFPKGSKILTIHTGGLQGIDGMNARLKKMNLPTINYV